MEQAWAPAGPHLDSDDVAGLLEAHFEDLSTGPTADLPLIDQVRHLSWMSLRAEEPNPQDKDASRAGLQRVNNCRASPQVHDAFNPPSNLNRGMTGNEFDTEPKRAKQKRVIRLVGPPPLQYSHQSAATILKEALCFIPHLSLGLQVARGGRWSLVQLEGSRLVNTIQCIPKAV